jgi:hypothetical protein
MAKRGRKQGAGLRRAVATLRQKGLPAPQIGRRLGVPTQAVSQVCYDLAGVSPNRCRECAARLTDRPLALRDTAPTYCLGEEGTQLISEKKRGHGSFPDITDDK